MTSFFIGFVIGYTVGTIVSYVVFRNALLRHNAKLEQKQ